MPEAGHPASDPPRIGISSCLLGEPVRYDGGHKRNAFIAGGLARFVDFVPRCPEVAVGLGVPREPLRLTRDGGHLGARGVDSGTEAGTGLTRYGDQQAPQLTGLCGYLFKSRSPSCGPWRVPVFGADGNRLNVGARGLYAARIVAALPWLPVEDEERLQDPALRNSFLTRVFTLHRLQRALAEGTTAQALVAFHTDHKLLLLAHHVAAYRRLGRLVAGAGSGSVATLIADYRARLMQALHRPARIAGHVNALQHLAGYLRGSLTAAARRELAQAIDAYAAGQVPWTAVRTLLQGHFRRHPHAWVARQVYFEPYPEALATPAAEPASA